MNIIYKCQYTGKEFDSPEYCEVHEYIHGGEQQKFYDLVDDFIIKLEEKYPSIKVDKSSLKVEDYKEFLYEDRIERQRCVAFDFTMNGEQQKYRRYSDEIGDWSWNWNIEDNVDSFILDFEKEFIYPNMKILEGVVEQEWGIDYGLVTTFGELSGDYLLKLLRNKKVRIEVLEDFNEYEADEE